MARSKEFPTAPEAGERFRRELEGLVAPATRLAIAVSGGADSLALLLLAAQVRPSLVEAATVDHGLRRDSAAEAEMVAGLCGELGVPHRVLTVHWDEPPATAIQEQARTARYRLLAEWARERELGALVTAHHLDDQAETFLMRLARGAGVKGLGAMRPVSRAPGSPLPLVRPLLGWRRSELEAVCDAAGVKPVHDTSNDDDQFERVRVRKMLAGTDWLDAGCIAASARHLAEADAALHWATSAEWQRAVTATRDQVVYRPTDAPGEIRRRIVRRAILMLATEGGGAEPRGRELDQLLAVLRSGRRATLRGVLCIGGAQWRFTRAPPRRA